MRKNPSRTYRVKANLNLILWLSFILFSLVITALFTVVQNVIAHREFREQLIENTREASSELYSRLKNSEKPAEVSRIMLSVVNRFGVSAYLFSSEGVYIFPEVSVEEADEYAAIAERVKDSVDALEIREDRAVEISSETEYSLAFAVDAWGENGYLYVTSSLRSFNEFTKDLLWFSVITALFAVALGFVVSGFVSMIITKPVSEVTEKAKELARGNYDVKFGDSYCTEVAELSEALNYAGSEISKADKMQKELIANVSHDFKTPLTMIKAYASMIREISGGDPEKRLKHTQIIIDEADRLAALVGDVLDLSRLQAGIDSFERTVFNLSEEVYRVARRFDYLVETGGYLLQTDIDDDLYTYAAKERVEQALYNLIGNAFNYTGEDKKVIVRLKKSDGFSRFEVADTGKGIPEEELNSIWERYYRSSETHKRPVQGTGLGLSIVKSILLRYNIPFGVQSKVGQGTCFRVDFPDPPEPEKKDKI